jgi:hypothetical protein
MMVIVAVPVTAPTVTVMITGPKYVVPDGWYTALDCALGGFSFDVTGEMLPNPPMMLPAGSFAE